MTSSDRTLPLTGRVVNIAHRGASGVAPEQTFPAWDLALAQGAHYIELDLQMTRDGTLVAFHDSILERTARGPASSSRGLVRDKTMQQLRECEVGSWFDQSCPRGVYRAYEPLKIPTLAEVFERYGHRTNYCIEVKDPEANLGIEENLLSLLNEHGLITPTVDEGCVLIQSFFPGALRRIQALNRGVALIQLYAGMTSEGITRTLESVAEYSVGIGVAYGDADRALVDSAHEVALRVHPYTVNGTADMAELLSLGVDGIITDYPRRLTQLLGGKYWDRTSNLSGVNG